MYDAIVVGGGLAGMVAAAEIADRGGRVAILDQEGENSFGGQAHWSLGGLFFVDSPEQRRMGIKDSPELALSDWMGSAGFDRDEDHWPREWAKAFIEFSHGPMRPWLHDMGMRWFPIVGWAERGGSLATDHGNSVPRFHMTWGTGPGVVAPFERRVMAHVDGGLIELKFRHRVTGLTRTDGVVTGVTGDVLAPSKVDRGQQSNRDVAGDFALDAGAVIVASGGIGGDHEKVRRNWPTERLGPAPTNMITGVPHHVDGDMIDTTEAAGAAVINKDRMWHYVEGIRNWDPIWPKHAIRVLPGPSSLWLDADGNRLPAPCLPGFDTLATLKHIISTGHDYSWFILTQAIIEKEFALSGSEQNADMTSQSIKEVLKSRLGSGATPEVEAFKEHGADFVVADDLETLVAGMNKVAGNDLLDAGKVREVVEARDRQVENPFSKDAQIMALHAARNYRGDKIFRAAPPHKILDPKHGPLIGVQLHVLTRKSLGGIHTNLDAAVLDPAGDVIPGLYAIGEAAGFGGGGYHGYNALEGTFLGGCIFSGRQAGRAVASSLA